MKKSFKNTFNNFKPRKTLEATVHHFQPLEIKPRFSQAGGGKPSLMKKRSAASFRKTPMGSQIQNIGFPLRTSGFQLNPLFLSNFVDEGIYTYIHPFRLSVVLGLVLWCNMLSKWWFGFQPIERWRPSRGLWRWLKW